MNALDKINADAYTQKIRRRGVQNSDEEFTVDEIKELSLITVALCLI